MNKIFGEKIIKGANDIINITNDCLEMGCTFEETFPATSYVEVEAEGKTFLMKIEVTIIKSK